eukprot:944707-Amphidinium_carterae.1
MSSLRQPHVGKQPNNKRGRKNHKKVEVPLAKKLHAAQALQVWRAEHYVIVVWERTFEAILACLAQQVGGMDVRTAISHALELQGVQLAVVLNLVLVVNVQTLSTYAVRSGH